MRAMSGQCSITRGCNFGKHASSKASEFLIMFVVNAMGKSSQHHALGLQHKCAVIVLKLMVRLPCQGRPCGPRLLVSQSVMVHYL